MIIRNALTAGGTAITHYALTAAKARWIARNPSRYQSRSQRLLQRLYTPLHPGSTAASASLPSATTLASGQ